VVSPFIFPIEVLKDCNKLVLLARQRFSVGKISDAEAVGTFFREIICLWRDKLMIYLAGER
jgi:hypothetical protein